ncbi:MAG: hypothetical protein ACPH04_02470 [Candidatus Poseidoniaceae archaeon]
MTTERRSAVVLVVSLLLVSLSPVVGSAAADDAIHLSVDVQHVVLTPGGAANVTLTITNNGSSIDSFDVEVDNASLHPSWEVLALDANVTNVFPTWSKNTTIVVRLDGSGVPSHADTVDLVVSDADGTAETRLTLALSVADVHAPRIEASGAGDGGLVTLQPGDIVDVTVPVFNDGNVVDTMLLDVNANPDLAGFWANWSSTGSNTNVSDNQTGNTSTTPSFEVLMYGNSYTAANGLDGLLENLLREVGDANVSANAGGGMTLEGHRSKVNASGDTWNTSLSGQPWDIVVLQDQSQIPGFPRTQSEWIDSKDAAIALTERIEDEGAEMMLLMTWGRRSGDSMNTARFPNFTAMNDHLLQGYLDYAENVSNAHPSASVYVAPVGLAFAKIHDDLLASGTDPDQTGTLFHDLYTSDGSHPSLHGSYLAAATLHAAIHGGSPVGLALPSGINASAGQALQLAAAHAVFNATSTWTYPWTTSGVSSTAVVGGDLLALFSDDVLENVSAFSSQSATLRLEVAPNAVPGDVGLDLVVASTKGNTTSSSTLVVRIEAVPDLSIGNIDSSELLPFGVASLTSVDVVNTGTSAAEWSWELGASGAANCVWDLLDLTSTFAGPGDVATVDLSVEVPPASSWPPGVQEVCEVDLIGSWANDSSVQVSRTIGFVVDERVDTTFAAPASVEVDVDAGTAWQATFQNAGSHALSVTLTMMAPSSPQEACDGRMSTSMVSSATQSVAAGSTGVWSFETDVVTTETCAVMLEASTVHGVATQTVAFTPADHAALVLQGPSDARVAVEAGSTTDVTVTLTQTGTEDLDVVLSTSGLPGGVTLTDASGASSVMLSSAVPSVEVVLTVVASPEATIGDHDVVLTFTDSEHGSWSLDLAVQVSSRRGVDVVATSGNGQGDTWPQDIDTPYPGAPTLGGLAQVSTTMTVVNTGANSATFVLSATTVFGSQGLTVTLEQDVVSLAEGESVVIPVHLSLDGSASDGEVFQVMLMANSSLDASVSDAVVQSVVHRSQQVTIAVDADNTEVEAGGTITGTLRLSSRVDDRLTLSASGAACTLPGPVNLSGSSEALPWSCTLAEGAPAGLVALNVSVRSAISALGADVLASDAVVLTVLASWAEAGPIQVVVEDASLSIETSGSATTVVRITNTANALAEGELDLAGSNLAYLQTTWVRLGDGARTSSFSLEPGASARYTLEMVRLTTGASSAEPEVLATYTMVGVERTESGGTIAVDLPGPELPPAGLDLGLVQLSNQDSLIGLSSGWIVALLLFGLLRIRRSSKPQPEEEDEQETEADLPELGHNEARIGDGNKVACPSCDAVLGVPAGSEPPFRFTCPTCQSSIRVLP